MRALVLVLLTVIAVVAPAAAAAPLQAEETYVCWTETRLDDDLGLPRDVLVCRISGGEVVVYEGRLSAPAVLHPAVARGADGSCWYWRDGFTGWVLIGSLGSSAVMRYEPPAGGALLYDATFERCERDPGAAISPIELVWRVVRRYPAPVPEVAIDPPLTVTGLDTYVAADPPPPITDSIVSPATGRTITVVLGVAAVAVAWGDGEVMEVDPGSFDRLGGHPDGVARHVYDTRGSYSVVVAYERVARWRVDGGPWRLLDLGSAATVTQLRVDELVARRVG